MKIAIEAERANIKNPTGVERYAKQLIMKLAEVDRENSFILYLRTQPKPWILNLPKNFSYKVMPFPLAWTQLRISWEILVNKPDALFIPASSLPFIHPKNSTVVIHDLAWLYFPETFTKWQLFTLKLFTWYASSRARKVIAISEQTKKDLIKKYSITAEKITVVHHGFDFSQEDEVSDAEETEKIKNLPEKFILYLGTMQPRKNPQGLVDAFIELKKKHNIPHALVLAGGKGWLYHQIMEKIKEHPDIIYFGYVKNRLELLKKADFLVHPSFYEGSALQIIDAFMLGIPVASSNAPALPEIAGDAAVYFDPKNPDQIQQALLRVATDSNLRQLLSNKGKERAKLFELERTAKQTLAVIMK